MLWALERAGPLPSHTASLAVSASATVQRTWKWTWRRHNSWRRVEPPRSGLSETRSTSRWIVTQSPRRSGSMTTSHTWSGGASISIEAETRLTPETLSRGERLAFLPFAQRPFHRGVEGVQAHAEQIRGDVVAGEEVVAQALHERPDEVMVLARDHGADPAGDA